MTAPTFKRATDATPEPTGAKYTAPDIVKIVDVLTGAHATERIQASVIEGLSRPFNAFIKIEGSNFVVRDPTNSILHSGTDAKAALQVLLNQSGHLHIGPGTYTISSTSGSTHALLAKSNSHIECDVNTLIKVNNPSNNAAFPLLRNETTSPQGTNQYIILEGGTWDGQCGLGSPDADPNTPSSNIQFEGTNFVWVNRVRSLNGMSECIKVRNAQRSWITNCYVKHSRLPPNPDGTKPANSGTGKAGIHATAGTGEHTYETIMVGNVCEDCGGEGLGSFGDVFHTIIANNTTRFLTYGRGQILLEGDSSASEQPRQIVIANNTIVAKYAAINLKSVEGVNITGNHITTIDGGFESDGSAKGEGIEVVGNCKRIRIQGNTFYDIAQHGIDLIASTLVDCVISDNSIINVGGRTADAAGTYNGIKINAANNWTNMKICDNLIEDDRGASNRMGHGINFVLNGKTITNCWVHDNQVYGMVSPRAAINLDWTVNGRFLSSTRFLNNSGYNQTLITNPFNNSHSEIGLHKASDNQFTYASIPTASTEYSVVMSPILITSAAGTAVSITVKDTSGGTSILPTAATTINTPMYLPIGSTINWGAFTGTAPVVRVVGCG